MDGATLMAAMTYPGYPAPLPLSRYNALAWRCEVAFEQANCTTVNRRAMFLSQIGAESGSLRWTQELASGSDYDRYINPDGPWQSLGNIYAGDGEKFKGRSFIQITGRTHYSNLSKWAYSKHYVPTKTYFIDHPTALADDQYAFLGPVWYWTVARPGMNGLADAGNINGATYAVNGGYNNLSGRTARWHKCLSLGNALLPAPTPTPPSGTTTGAADMYIVSVSKADCKKAKKNWPGIFLTDGVNLRHIPTVSALNWWKSIGVKVAKTEMPLAVYQSLGGK